MIEMLRNEVGVDLAPEIYRQRLVIEGVPTTPIDDDAIRAISRPSSPSVCGMTTLIEPVTHRSDRYGWAGWIHWETSGCALLRVGAATSVLQRRRLHLQGLRRRGRGGVHPAVLRRIELIVGKPF